MAIVKFLAPAVLAGELVRGVNLAANLLKGIEGIERTGQLINELGRIYKSLSDVPVSVYNTVDQSRFLLPLETLKQVEKLKPFKIGSSSYSFVPMEDRIQWYLPKREVPTLRFAVGAPGAPIDPDDNNNLNNIIGDLPQLYKNYGIDNGINFHPIVTDRPEVNMGGEYWVPTSKVSSGTVVNYNYKLPELTYDFKNGFNKKPL